MDKYPSGHVPQVGWLLQRAPYTLAGTTRGSEIQLSHRGNWLDDAGFVYFHSLPHFPTPFVLWTFKINYLCFLSQVNFLENQDPYTPLPLFCDTQEGFWLGLGHKNERWLKGDCDVYSLPNTDILPFYFNKLSSFLRPLLSLSIFLFFAIWSFQSLAHANEKGWHEGRSMRDIEKKIAYNFTVLITKYKIQKYNLLFFCVWRDLWLDHMLVRKCVLSQRNGNVNLFASTSVTLKSVYVLTMWTNTCKHTYTHIPTCTWYLICIP